tara:strand:+ start:350 stop:607 length:258 start_codon:yes stop_codon:yes gene_type:complete
MKHTYEAHNEAHTEDNNEHNKEKTFSDRLHPHFSFSLSLFPSLSLSFLSSSKDDKRMVIQSLLDDISNHHHNNACIALASLLESG